jgi:hypothetical protein
LALKIPFRQFSKIIADKVVNFKLQKQIKLRQFGNFSGAQGSNQMTWPLLPTIKEVLFRDRDEKHHEILW